MYPRNGAILSLAPIHIDTRETTKGGGCPAVTKRKLNYRFHNPNTAEATADYLVKLFIEANRGKVERAILAASDKLSDEKQDRQNYEGHPA